MQAENTVKLGDVAEFTNGGAWNQGAYVDSGVPVVRVSDIHDYTVDLSNCKFLPQSALDKYSKNILDEGDLVICTVGSHPTQPNSVVGRPGIMPKECKGALLNQNAVCIRPVNSDLDKTWLGYLARSQKMKDHIIGHARGSASQVRVAIGALKDFRFSLPDIDIQKVVARSLQNYDNLIENNNRRIAILEDLAQSLYREWFVKFRYPGHENQTLVDSPLGDIPEGWEVRKLSDIAKVNPEGITKKNAPDCIRYIDIKSVSTGSINETREMLFAEAPSRARRKVQHGDVIWATVRPNRKQYSFIAKPKDNTVVSTGFAVLRAHSVSPAYLYFAVTTDDFSSYLVNHATGSAYPAVNAKDFENALVLKPDNATLTKFDSLVSPCVDQIEVLKNKNINLKQQRDMLLPKLISGKINMSNKESL